MLTNQFERPAREIGLLYRNRWQVELFFKWIKQPLRMRSFYGRSENAVRCQIWPAICACLMVAILRKRLILQKSLNEILQIVSVNIFDQTPLEELLASKPQKQEPQMEENADQKLLIFNDQ